MFGQINTTPASQSSTDQQAQLPFFLDSNLSLPSTTHNSSLANIEPGSTSAVSQKKKNDCVVPITNYEFLSNLHNDSMNTP